MPGNPQIAQGTLNRVRGSVIVTNFPQLNVTAPILGQAGISLNPEGEITGYIPTLAGAVTSPNPVQMCRVTIHMLKTQGLSAAWEAQLQTLSAIGDVTVVPDTSVYPNYYLVNCAITGIAEMPMNGTDAGYVVTVAGYREINNSLWSLT